MKLRNSERSTWKTCRFRWSWTYRDGLQAVQAPYALRFGDLIHQALAAYRPPGRKFGPNPAETFERLYMENAAQMRDDGFDVFSDDKWVDALDLGKGMLENYVLQFAHDDSQYEVLSSEQTFQRVIRVPAMRRELPGPKDPFLTREEQAQGPIIYVPSFSFKIVGTLDGVWRHIKTGRIVFKEYKTATALSEDGLAMDEQPTVYWTYAPRWLVMQGMLTTAEAKSIREVLYTFLRKAVPPGEDRAKNADGLYLNKPSKDALLEAYKDLGHGASQPPKGCNNVPWLTEHLTKYGVDVPQLGEISKSQPAPFFNRTPVHRNPADRARLHERILDEAREIWMARHGMMPLYKNPGPLHSPNCRGCAVRDACEAHEAGADHQSVLDATTIKWAPYAAHELPERT
jgi:hypothetical protein